MSFDFDARTNDFAEVNAYYHCNQFFSMMKSMGFDIAGYFGRNTSFPTPVDHRRRYQTADGNEINAYCMGTAGGKGILRTAFMLADKTDTSIRWAWPVTIVSCCMSWVAMEFFTLM